MLGRGMDVKVVELPTGNDPADMIQADLAGFKKLVGKSVTVIDFLCNVLQREFTDPRQCMTEVKRQVYPLANLAPSHTEQYSYAKIIAARLSVPVDVVWRDMEYLQSEAKLQPSVTTDVTPSSVAPRMQTDSARSTFLYLEVIKSVTDPAISTIVTQQLEEYIPKHDLKITDAEIAELSFTLENQIEHTPQLELYSEIVTKLNWLRKKLISQQLSIYKMQQQQAAADGNENEELRLSGLVAELAKLQAAPTLTLELFGETS